MTPEQFQAQNPTLTAGELAAAYPNDPQNYLEVPSERILAWMGGGVLKRRLERFTASVPEGDPREELASAVETTFLAATNPKTGISVAPGSRDRLLIDSLVALGQITASEAGELINRGYAPGYGPTADAAAFQAILDQRARQAAADAANANLAKAEAINDAHASDAAVSLVTIPEPETPDGYTWTTATGELTKNP